MLRPQNSAPQGHPNRNLLAGGRCQRTPSRQPAAVGEAAVPWARCVCGCVCVNPIPPHRPPDSSTAAALPSSHLAEPPRRQLTPRNGEKLSEQTKTVLWFLLRHAGVPVTRAKGVRNGGAGLEGPRARLHRREERLLLHGPGSCSLAPCAPLSLPCYIYICVCK